jgi:peptidoglycan/xylan/chitin deacetylase (PgdA/CDA1 family)
MRAVAGGILLSVLVLAQAAPIHTTAAETAACPGQPDALSVSRVIAVNPAVTPRVGRKHFPQTLPLAEKEVVLTFDDGPRSGTTAAVLDSLKRECVRATFFLIGRNAAMQPELVRRERAEGHTVAYHSFSHPLLDRMSVSAAEAEIDRGIAAVETALQGRPASRPQTPFFRFPGFASSPILLERLAERKMVVVGADFWASDWNPMSPQQELQLVLGRLQAAGSGIVLFRDTKQQTAAMLPAFLRSLKVGGYRVVHMVGPPAECPEYGPCTKN